MLSRVDALAATFTARLKRAQRVSVWLPIVVEAVVVMLACSAWLRVQPIADQTPCEVVHCCSDPGGRVLPPGYVSLRPTFSLRRALFRP